MTGPFVAYVETKKLKVDCGSVATNARLGSITIAWAWG